MKDLCVLQNVHPGGPTTGQLIKLPVVFLGSTANAQFVSKSHSMFLSTLATQWALCLSDLKLPPSFVGRYTDRTRGWEVLGPIFGRAKLFFSSPKLPDLFCAFYLLFNGQRWFISSVKRTRCKADNFSTYGSEVKNEWSYTSPPPMPSWCEQGYLFRYPYIRATVLLGCWHKCIRQKDACARTGRHGEAIKISGVCN
jgi:hypothetical protein